MSSYAVRRTRLLLAAGLVVLVAAVPALAASPKNYSVVVSGTVVAGHDVAFAVKVSVPTSQQQQVGSADLTLPPKFTLLSAAIVAPGLGSATPSDATVQLRSLALQPGQSVTVQVRASVPCKPGDSVSWTALAKQSNDFNGPPGNTLDLNVDASVLSTPVVGFCTPCPAGAECEPATVTSGSTMFTVRGHAAPTTDQTTLALGAGPQIDCANYRELMAEAALFNVTGDRAKTMMARVPKADLPRGGQSALELCFGSPDPFTTKSGLPAAQQGTYDFTGDGTPDPVYVGLLPDCRDVGDIAPCVTGRDRIGDFGVIQAKLIAGDPAGRG